MRKRIFFICMLALQIEAFGKNIPIINQVSGYLLYIPLIILSLLAIYVISKQKLRKSTYILLFFMFAIGVLSMIITGNATLLTFLVIIFNCLFLDDAFIYKNDLKIKLIVLLVVLLCYQLKICNDLFFIRNNIVRYSLGFIHPNTLGLISLLISNDILILRKNDNILRTSIMLMPFLILILASGSRTSLVILVMLYGLRVVRNKRVVFVLRKMMGVIGRILIPTIIIGTLLLTVLYSSNNAIMNEINVLLSNRLYLQSFFFKEYGLSLLGSPINYETLALDNMVMRSLSLFGILGSIIIFYCVQRRLARFNRPNDYKMFYTLVLFALYGVSEWSIIRPTISPIAQLSIISDKRKRTRLYYNTSNRSGYQEKEEKR